MMGWVFHGGTDVYIMSREDGFNMYLYNFIGKIIQNLYAAPFFFFLGLYSIQSLYSPAFFLQTVRFCWMVKWQMRQKNINHACLQPF